MMVGRKPRKSKRQSLMGSHNRCWLWGRHVVHETLVANRWPIVELRLSEDLNVAERAGIVALAAERSLLVTTETPERMTQLCGATDHQGYLAKMRPFPLASVDELLSGLSANPVLCLLEGIQDPHNFGAIIRSAEVLGLDGVIVPQSRQSDVTAIVARSSAGAVNYLPLAQTEDLVATALRLRDEYGMLIVAADQRATPRPAQQDWTRPMVLIIGNESSGISEALRSMCDQLVRIPQEGQTESLNAGVAAGILFYEVQRQRTSGREE